MTLEYSEDRKRTMTETEIDAIENSISTIASTPYGTAPYMRSMGIKKYPPETDSDVAKNQYATEVITQCGIWEDRVKVSEVKFTDDNNAKVVIGNV
ncbi:hypothetical protein [Pseudobutyrivibrio sp.]|uniref:hypothetical protein n=1 Tax=Pseudobutyrivibrio sp. TaxID=2014367 RepID=UPI001DE8F434|nr:hypothetical protein [Pseudobutyrivibrio sp.]MBE5910879.1 hypothetical protein [Pseudobutyrivibrio sp.]